MKLVDLLPSYSFSETKNPKTLQAHETKMIFFTPDTLNEICRRLIGHYFLLTQEDLQIWDSDPEEFSGYPSLLYSSCAANCLQMGSNRWCSWKQKY